MDSTKSLNKDMHSSEIPLQQIFEMRDFMDVCRDYVQMVNEEMVILTSPSKNLCEDREFISESMLVGTMSHPIFEDLKDIMHTLKAFMESSGGDYALGVEDGMQRAAEMIENILKRHEDK